MAVPILFHGEDYDAIVEKMRFEAMSVLGVEKHDALLRYGDYQEVLPTSKSYLYTMDVIQSVVEESSLPPWRGKKRVVALLSIDRMLSMHANALLKTLEDAPEYFHLMLVTTKYNAILKTILSRVQKRYIEGSGQLWDYSIKIEEMFTFLKEERFDSFFKGLEEIDKTITENVSDTEKKLRHFLETFLNIYKSKLVQRHLVAASTSKVEKMLDVSLKGFNSNIKIKHVLENLFLETQQLNYNS